MFASHQLCGNRIGKRWVTPPNLHGLGLHHIDLVGYLSTGSTSKDLVVVVAVGGQRSLRLDTRWVLA